MTQVPDVEHPAFFQRLDRMLEHNKKLSAVNAMSLPAPLRTLLGLPFMERLVAEMFQASACPALQLFPFFDLSSFP